MRVLTSNVLITQWKITMLQEISQNTFASTRSVKNVKKLEDHNAKTREMKGRL